MASKTQAARFDRTLERIAFHGDVEGNDAEIQDLRDFCELLFSRVPAAAERKKALDEMNRQLDDAEVMD